MPFFLIPTTLGVCFFLIWAFIGGMIFRDSQLAVQREAESDAARSSLPLHRPRTPSLRSPKSRRLRRTRVRLVS